MWKFSRKMRAGMCTPLVGLIAVLTGIVPVPASATINHVIQISVDGVNSDILKALVDANSSGDFDNYNRFEDEGAGTWNARTDHDFSNTLPNHTSMLTGRPAGGNPGTGSCTSSDHCYTNNGEPAGSDTLHNNHPGVSYMHGVFEQAHDRGLSTAMYASKTKFIIYQQTWVDNGQSDPETPPDDGAIKIDDVVIKNTPRQHNPVIDDAFAMQQDFLSDMAANEYNYVFVHYVDPDKSGHQYGWNSTGIGQYTDTLRNVDDYLGEVFNLVETDAGLVGETAIILSADHGGGENGNNWFDHQCATPCESDYTINFHVWGPGVKAGGDLYAMNPSTRSDPGAGTVDFGAGTQPIRNGDGGNLALDLLGLPAIPGSAINASQDLEVLDSSIEPFVPSVPSSSALGKFGLALLLLLPALAVLRRRRT
jgi:hypothetical protein